MNTKYGIVILAAGGSSRLGKPKQLLTFNDKSLLQNVINAALMVKEASVILVTGADHNTIEKEVSADNVIVTYNEYWHSGMASSIRKGVQRAVSTVNPESIIIAVCDQPFVNNIVFENIIASHELSGKAIVASKYSDTIGTPALFSRKYFSALEKLSGDEGAKKIIKQGKNDVEAVHFDKGMIDIDTSEDYKQLMELSKSE